MKKFDDKWYILVEALPGEDAGQSITKQKTIQAAKNLAKLHNYGTFDDFGFPEVDDKGSVNIADSSYEEWITDNFEESIERFSQRGQKSLSNKLQSISAEFEDHIPKEYGLVICHNDYSPDNVLYNKRDELTGVIDFDISYIGHSHRDVAKAANSFWMHDPLVDWNVRKTFYQGYDEVGELGPPFYKNEEFYRLESLVVTISYLIELGLLSEDKKVRFYEESIYDALKRLEE